MKITLYELWEATDAKEREEFMAGICKRYPSLICEKLKTNGKCPALKMKVEDET